MPTPGFTAGLSLSEGRDTVVGAFANKLVHDPRRSRTQNVLGQLKVDCNSALGATLCETDTGHGCLWWWGWQHCW
jgi:hypothetical protein